MRISKSGALTIILVVAIGTGILVAKNPYRTEAQGKTVVPVDISNPVKQGSTPLQTNNPTDIVNEIVSGSSFLVQASSNPYDYIKNNDYYKQLVKMGPDALPLLEDSIVQSKSNGLNEYILAIAIEDIAKVNLKTYEGKKFGWETARGFVTEWDKHLKNIPETVKSIQSSSASKKDKIDALVQLGVPAVPFITDSIEQGNQECAGALAVLLKDNTKVSFSTNDLPNSKEWVQKNKSQFAQLRAYVESKNK